MSRKHVTSVLTEAAEHYYTYKFYSVHREFGVTKGGKLRLDLLCLSTKMQFVGVEVKSCFSDWKNDTKWTKYLKYTNKFYFMLPPSLVSSSKYDKILSELKPYGAGVMSLNEFGRVYVAKSAKTREVADITARNLLVKMAWRSGTTCRDIRRRRQKFHI